MHRRDFLQTLAVLPMTSFWPDTTARAATAASQQERPAVKRIALSLRAVLGDPAGGLDGATSLHGHVDDRANSDIALLALCDPARVPLSPYAIAVALRAMTLCYVKGRTYSHPGCTIDPDPRVVERLAAIGQRLHRHDPAALDDWNRTCKLPQLVRIIGLQGDAAADPSSEYAQSCVLADAAMKGLVDGTDAVPGVASAPDLELQRIRADLEAGGRPAIRAGMSMSRYWFNAGRVRVVHDAGAAIIRECPMVVSTEAQMLGKGEMRDSGRRDDIADRVAANITKMMASICESRAVYQRLQSVFEITAVAAAIAAGRALEGNKPQLNASLRSCRVPAVDIPQRLPGRPAIKGFEWRTRTATGYSMSSVRLPSCGGVTIDVRSKLDAHRDSSGALAMFARTVLAARPSPTARSWPIPATA